MHPRTPRRLRLVAALILVVAFSGASGFAGHAQIALASTCSAISGSTFESGDGDLAASAGCQDWNAPGTAGPVNHQNDLPSGTSDNSFGQGSKEDNGCNTVVFGSIPPNKSDLTRMYEAHQRTGSGTSATDFLYLAWERSNVLGNANMDFEFNQSTAMCPNGVTPVKMAGDVLITFDFGGSGVPDLGKLVWLTTGSATNCFASSSLPCWGNRVDLTTAGDANGAVNSGTVNDTVETAPLNLPAGTFGEAGINLTAAGLFPSNQCVNFGSISLNSRSSSSFTSEIKDFIAPLTVNLTNCGQVKVIKTTSPANDPTSFNYTSTSNTSTSFPNTTGATHAFSLTGQSASNTYDSGVNTLLPGTYSVTEGAEPTNWLFSGLNCTSRQNPSSPPVTVSGTTATITLAAGDLVTCNYLNSEKLAPSLVTRASTELTAGGPVLSGSGTTSATGFNMTVPINSQISDNAAYSGTLGPVTGTVTFNLYFVKPGVDPTTACVAANQITSLPPGFSNVALTSGSASSPYYDTSMQSAVGTYVWQDVYTPASGSSYTSLTEPCGDEVVHIMDAKILLTPGQAANEVGAPHTLTATVETTTDGTTYAPVAGANVVFSLNTNSKATFVGNTSACTTGPDGTCTVQITDSTAEIVTIDAKALSFTQTGLSVGSFTRETGDGLSNDSPMAKKYYVDAKISISPTNAINLSGANHTVTATLLVNYGDGAGFVALSGAPVTITLTTDTCGATPTGPFSGTTDSFGTTTATFSCSGTGAIVAQAGSTLQVTPSGCTNSLCTVTLTRTTGDTHAGDSVNANKEYANARISISPLAPVNLVGNAETFTITVQQSTSGGATPVWNNVPDGTLVSYSIGQSGTNTFPSDATIGSGTCPESSTFSPALTGNGVTTNGQLTVTVFACQAGKIDVHASTSVTIADANDPSQSITVARATGDAANVALGGSSDAVKTYINPNTTLSVADTLTGLDSSMNGTVTYTAYPSIDCTGTGVTEGTSSVTSGVATKSTSVDIGPSTTWGDFISFRATFTGSGSVAGQTFTSPCTETASSQ